MNIGKQNAAETLEKFIEKELRISFKMEWAKAMGGSKNGMILAKVKEEGQKEEIMKRKNMGEESIFIGHDYKTRKAEEKESKKKII